MLRQRGETKEAAERKKSTLTEEHPNIWQILLLIGQEGHILPGYNA